MAVSEISGKASDAPHNNFLMTQELMEEVKKYGESNGKYFWILLTRISKPIINEISI